MGKIGVELALAYKRQETETFQSFVTKKIYKINPNFHCNNKFVVYFISCKVCNLQYVESTVDRFHLGWSNYKCSQRIVSKVGTPKQNLFHQHFLSATHHGLLNDCETELIGKTFPSDPTRRKFF